MSVVRNLQKIMIVVGTRPEAIKLAPVVLEFRRRSADVNCLIVCTGQHHEMAIQALNTFGLSADVQLQTMVPGQSLGLLTSNLFSALDKLMQVETPDWVVVQGDTTSALVAAMVAFYRGTKVAHVEAGLRTHDRRVPFPEEINRVFIGKIADVHFAPTRISMDNLIREGVASDAIRMTGNTVVDAVELVRDKIRIDATRVSIGAWLKEFVAGRRLILVTCHRRESFGEGVQNICKSLVEITKSNPDVVIVFPVHLNPSIKGPVERLLSGNSRIELLPPLGYEDLIFLIENSYLVLTDSGGLQEEVPTFKRPILIMRDTTERPEVVEAGLAMLVGTSVNVIVASVNLLLTDADLYRSMVSAPNPFGDGKAGGRIASYLLGDHLEKVPCLPTK